MVPYQKVNITSFECYSYGEIMMNNIFLIQGARICEYLESIRQTNESGLGSNTSRAPPSQVNSPSTPVGTTGILKLETEHK